MICQREFAPHLLEQEVLFRSEILHLSILFVLPSYVIPSSSSSSLERTGCGVRPFFRLRICLSSEIS